MDEQQFRKNLIRLKAEARKQGDILSKEQIHKEFIMLNITDVQLELVYQYLKDEKITLVENEEERLGNDVEPKEEVIGDYLKMYIEDLNTMNIPDKDERLNRITDVLLDKSKAGEVIPTLYLKEVVDIAKLYEGQGVAIEDLIGEGNIGVLLGIKMLDTCDTPVEVEEFMVKMIMDSMEGLIMEQYSEVDFDLKVLERVNELNDCAKAFSEDIGRKATIKEIALEMEMSEEYIKETLQLSGNAIEYVEVVENEEYHRHDDNCHDEHCH